MKKIIFAVIIFLIVLKLVDIGQEKTAEKLWRAPLPETYPLINKIDKISHRSTGNLLSELSKSGDMAHIASHQRDQIHKELINAVKEFPGNTAVEQAAILTFESDRLQVEMLEWLIGNHEEANRTQKGKIDQELKRVWKQHLQEKADLLKAMKQYYTPLGTSARDNCEISACSPPYVKITELSQMAYLLEKTDRTEEAAEYLQLAIDNIDKLEGMEREQMRQDLHTALGLIYLQQDRDTEAVSELQASEPQEAMLDIMINGWENDLAFALYQKGNRNAALAYWKDAVDFWEKQVQKEKDADRADVYRRSAKFARKRYEEMKNRGNN